MATTDAPTRERGVVSNLPQTPAWGSLFQFGTRVDDGEYADRFKWPTSVRKTIPEMLADSQVNALRMAVTLPTKRRRYMINPNGADEKIVRHVAEDLGLPIQGEDEQPIVIDPRRFSWGRHLHHVLLAPFMGHYYFSQYAPIEADGLAHLRKLLPLPPRTINELRADEGGGLEWIRQNIGRKNETDTGGRPKPIPVNALVAYVWDQEAGNWFGSSMLRPLLKDWLAKDDLIRGNLIKHRRNGMGVPTAKQTEKDADPTQLPAVQRVAQAWRVGEDASAGLPYGYDIELKGVEGTLPDAVASIQMHDQAMARSFLAMFLQLGQTQTGNRALGESFIDFFTMSLDALADWVCDVTNLHVIRDLVDWNYGEDVRLIPLLVDERAEDPELSVADLALLVQEGILTVDEDLEQMIRGRHGLPELVGPRPPEPTPPAPAPAVPAPEASSRRGSRRRGPFGRLADRLRGRPAAAAGEPHEEHVDWQGILDAVKTTLDALVSAWLAVRESQVEELAALVRQAGTDLEALAAIQATPAGSAIITDALQTIARYGVQTAVDEAAAQGHAIAEPELADLDQLLNDRGDAIASLLARSLSEAAARRALATAGGGVAPAEIADDVAEHLRGLTNAYLEEQLGGALAQGLRQGRHATMADPPAGTKIVASALLDTNVCVPCSHDDGHEWDTIAEAELQFPLGINKACEGGIKCRCTLVAIYPEAAPSVQ